MAGDDKQVVVENIRSAYQEYMTAVDGLSDEQLTKPFLGTWSVREITGHIIGWQEQMTIGFERMAKGERPSPDGANWGDVQSWNDRFAAGLGNQTARQLIGELDGRVATMITALQALPDDRFGEGKTANRMAEASGFGHFREHAPEIKEARQSGQI
ncbi:MAG: DinB family protein [Dehalococcoidia bacterium]